MLILCKAQAYRRSLRGIPTGGCLSFPPKPFYSISVHEKGRKDARSLKSQAIFSKDFLVRGPKWACLCSPWKLSIHEKFICDLTHCLGAKHCKRKENIYSLGHSNSFVHGKMKESCSMCVCLVWVFDEWIGILTVWGWKWTALLPQETVSVPLSFCLSSLSLTLSVRLNDMPPACELLSHIQDWLTAPSEQLKLRRHSATQFSIAQLNTTLHTTYLHTPKLDLH